MTGDVRGPAGTALGRSAVVIAVVLLGSALVVPGVATAAEEPRFVAYLSDPVVEPGGEVALSVQLVNDADEPEDEVKTARNVRAEMRAGGTPFTVRSGTTLLGDVTDGEVATPTFRIVVPRNVEPGTYRVPIELTYEFDPDRERTATVTVAVRVEERARFEVVGTETAASIGDAGTVTLALENVGTEVARETTVVVSAADAEIAFGDGAGSAESFVGRVEPGERTSVAVKVRIGEDAIRRNYSITATVGYLDPDGERHTESLVAGILPRPRQTFGVVSTDGSAPIGGTGRLVLELENRGPDTAYDATVAVSSPDADVGFAGGAPESESFVGRWTPGETVRVVYRLSVAPDALERNYTVRATIRYEDDEGRERTPATVLAAVRPLPEQTFEAIDVEAGLRAGEKGEIAARIENRGATIARDVVVVLGVDGTNLTPLVAEQPVGTLASGESAPVTFTVDVPRGAVPGPRRVTFEARYRTGEDDLRSSDRIGVDVRVTPYRPAFSVEPANATFPVDSSGTLVLSVSNDRDEPLTGLVATIAVEDPLSSDDPTAFVPELAPGASTTASFHLDVSDEAIPKAYPVVVAVEYTDDGGVERRAGPYRVAVSVVERPGSGFPVLPALAMVAAAAVAAVWWWRRRE